MLFISINDMCLNTKYISNHCFLLFGTIKIITIVCMIVCNTLQLINFMKALEKKGSLPVTVISSAVSFLLTGLLGLVLLGEKLSLMWFLGLVLIGIGMIFIAYSQKDSVDTNNTNNSSTTVTFAGSNIASKQKHEKHRNRVISN